jgi:hypothetical protein
MATEPLHPELKITLPKSKGGGLLTGLRIHRDHTRNILVIVSNRSKPNLIRGIILSLKHTAISPLTGVIQATAYTLSTRDLDSRTLKRGPNLEIFPHRVLKRTDGIVDLSVRVHAVRDSNKRVITGHSCTSKQNSNKAEYHSPAITKEKPSKENKNEQFPEFHKSTSFLKAIIPRFRHGVTGALYIKEIGPQRSF